MSWNNVDWAGMALKIAIAAVILLVTWVVALLVRKAFAALVGRVGVLQRQGADGHSLGESLGRIASLLVWLFGLMAVLQLFELTQVLVPISALLVGVMAFLPNLIGAAFVLVVGVLLAKIVRDIVQTALASVRFDRMLGRARTFGETTIGTSEAVRPTDAAGRTETQAIHGGAEYAGSHPVEYAADYSGATAAGRDDLRGTARHAGQDDTNLRIARTVGTVVYAIILVFVGIVSLQILGIAAISVPATAMLALFFAAIPKIVAAAVVLAIGVFIARFAGDLLAQVLDGFGADGALRAMQVLPEGKSATPVIAKITQVAVVLFFAVMAAQLLGFPQITAFLTEVLALGGRVLFGGAIIAAGFFLANTIRRLMGSGTGTAVVYWATIVLFVAMGLKYMGVADSIINLAFGAVVIGGALAAAIAFGIGGRDAAARTLERVEGRRRD